MDIQNIIQKYVSGLIAEKISKTMGLSEAQVAALLEKILPLFTAALAKNAAASDQGKQSLFAAIRDDHDGSVFNQLDDVVRDPKALKGDKILQHIFGAEEEVLETQVATDVGVSKEQSQQVFQMVAPLVMGALGKEQSDKKFGIDDMMGMLGNDQKKDLISQGLKLFGSLGK